MGKNLFVEVHAYRECGELVNLAHIRGGDNMANVGDTVRRGISHAHTNAELHDDHIIIDGTKACSPRGDGLHMFKEHVKRLRQYRKAKSGELYKDR